MSTEVMMVDDDPAICFTVEAVLSQAGISVRSVQSGQDCLSALREGFRGVILMDVMMPRLDGWQTIERIVDEGLLDGNVVCMLTAVVSPGGEMESLKEYVVDYIRKPFEIAELIDTVQQCRQFLAAA